ncbi:hypothetical protein, partial [Neomoorella thermoacetica]|uniref:hypothetical protein n=1 Tax=Neomoorella thermoacetica TaxID=1525 RepID=UPI001F199D33
GLFVLSLFSFYQEAFLLATPTLNHYRNALIVKFSQSAYRVTISLSGDKISGYGSKPREK